MDDTAFIQKKKSHKIVVLKGSRNVWSKCADANFHTSFSICVSAAKYVARRKIDVKNQIFLENN